MTPSTAKRTSIRYRYYVSAVLAQGRQSEAGSVARASAKKVEALVLEALRAAYPSDAELDNQTLIEARVERVVLRAGSVEVIPATDPSSAIAIAWTPASPSRWREILPSSNAPGDERGIKAEARSTSRKPSSVGIGGSQWGPAPSQAQRLAGPQRER